MFRAIDLTADSTDIMAHLLEGVAFRPQNIRLDASVHAASDAYRLVLERGLSFRDAYREIAAKIFQNR